MTKERKIKTHIHYEIAKRLRHPLTNENPLDIHDELIIKDSLTVQEFEEHEISTQIELILDEINLNDLENVIKNTLLKKP